MCHPESGDRISLAGGPRQQQQATQVSIGVGEEQNPLLERLHEDEYSRMMFDIVPAGVANAGRSRAQHF